MKKLELLVMPLMAVSLLASCNSGGGGGGDEPVIVTHEVTIVGEHDHLSFLTAEGEEFTSTKAIEKQDFKFRMKALEDKKLSHEFIVPDILNITIGGESVTDYDVYIKEGGTEADVVVSANKITDDIEISGRADIKNGYRYEAPRLYGVTADLGDGIYTKTDGQGLTIEFIAAAGGNLPNAENVYIELDNYNGEKMWFSPAEGYNDICTYDDATGKLTINSGAEQYIKSNVVIVARASDYGLLESATWEQISQAAATGYAEDMYYLGEEKTVEIYGRNHKVRIIDFNRDTDAKGNKLGITFEFVNAINNYGQMSIWGEDSTNFIESALNIQLNGDDGNSVLNELKKDPAEELGNYIKSVRKRVYVKENDKWINKPYDTYLFPLTYTEMGKDDKNNDRYEYYRKATRAIDSTRIKHLTGEEEKEVGTNYWLRSPRLSGEAEAMYIHWDGGVMDMTSDHYTYYAPAFCI